MVQGPPSGRTPHREARSAAREHTGGDASRQRILDAAERLIVRRGFASTGISAISEASGLPASSIYWHFESKRGLLAAVVERSAQEFIGELGAILTSDRDPRRRLRSFIETAISRAESNPPSFMRLMVMLALDSEHLENPLSEQLDQIRESGISLLRSVLSEIYRARGHRTCERLADDAALFAITFCEGSFIMQRIGPARVDGPSLAAQLEAALLAFPDFDRDLPLGDS